MIELIIVALGMGAMWLYCCCPVIGVAVKLSARRRYKLGVTTNSSAEVELRKPMKMGERG